MQARAEFEYYRNVWPDFSPKAEVTGRVAGIMVSRNKLLINRNTALPASRVEALLQHEVGTHLLTYYNGRAQPFRQLYSGLAGYEALQEGLAVLAEYLVGGLDRPRMRQLAARVVAARQLIEGASFVETFHTLHHTFGLPQHSVFRTTMRIHRGGGFTKDAIYLRGLRQILDYVGRGGRVGAPICGQNRDRPGFDRQRTPPSQSLAAAATAAAVHGLQFGRGAAGGIAQSEGQRVGVGRVDKDLVGTGLGPGRDDENWIRGQCDGQW